MALADRKAADVSAAAETPYPENAVKKAPAKKKAAKAGSGRVVAIRGGCPC